MIAVVTLMAVSCSDNKPELLKQVPADTDLVALIDAQAILESAGFVAGDGSLQVPQYVADKLSDSQMKDLAEAAALECVDAKAVVIAYNYSDPSPVAFFTLNCREEFVKYLSVRKYDEMSAEDGYTLYGDAGGSRVVVGQNQAYIYDGVRNPVFMPITEVKGMLSSAAKSDITSTPAGKKIGGHTVSMLAAIPSASQLGVSNMTIPGMPEGSMFLLHADLTGTELKAESACLDSDGKMLMMDDVVSGGFSTVDSEALKYLTADESLVMAFSLKGVDWDRVMELAGAGLSRSERASLVMIQPYLNAIDGTVAVGAGFADGMTSVSKIINGNGSESLSGLSFTALVQLKEERAADQLMQLKGLAQLSGMSMTNTDSCFSLALDQSNTIYVEEHDGMIIVANHPLHRSGANRTVAALPWGSYTGAIGLVLDKSDKIVSDLRMDYELSVELSGSKDGKSILVYTLKGGDAKGLIERTAKCCMEASDAVDRWLK